MAHPDLDQLLNAALPFAEQMLAKNGELQPFGVAMDSAGKVQMYGGHAGDGPTIAQEIIDLPIGGLRSEAAAGKLKATAVCIDIVTPPPGATAKTDAVGVWLEHADGEAVDVALPYRKVSRGRYEYGNLFAARGGHGVFPRTTGAV